MMRGVLVILCLTLAACGARPEPTAAPAPLEIVAAAEIDPLTPASLWNGGRSSLFGDRRAAQVGDILTVVIEIDDQAEISNATEASRSGSHGLSLGQLFGFPQRAAGALPAGASWDNAVDIDASSQADGDGSIKRNEKIALKIAATVVGVLPNGALQIQGLQLVTVNFETRELSVQGVIRPEDISRQNEITYDKIAEAQISYGGRGQITDMQRPRLGQQLLTLSPF